MPSNNVQNFREGLMMSKAELARKAGLSTLTIDRVEAGRPCRLDTKRKILLALGLKISDKDRVFVGEDLEDEAPLADAVATDAGSVPTAAAISVALAVADGVPASGVGSSASPLPCREIAAPHASSATYAAGPAATQVTSPASHTTSPGDSTPEAGNKGEATR